MSYYFTQGIISKKDTKRTESEIAIDTDRRINVPNQSFTKTVTLSNNIDTSYNENQAFNIYYDGTFIKTIINDENIEVILAIHNCGDIGLHTIINKN